MERPKKSRMSPFLRLKIQTYRSEIANQARKAIEDPESLGDPVTIFYPEFFK